MINFGRGWSHHLSGSGTVINWQISQAPPAISISFGSGPNKLLHNSSCPNAVLIPLFMAGPVYKIQIFSLFPEQLPFSPQKIKALILAFPLLVWCVACTKAFIFWERFSPNRSIKCERVELQNAIFNNCSTHLGLRPLEIGGNQPEVDITHRPRRRAKLCPVGPISMCNCNAFVVVLLTPWGPRTRPGLARPNGLWNRPVSVSAVMRFPGAKGF